MANYDHRSQGRHNATLVQQIVEATLTELERRRARDAGGEEDAESPYIDVEYVVRDEQPDRTAAGVASGPATAPPSAAPMPAWWAPASTPWGYPAPSGYPFYPSPAPLDGATAQLVQQLLRPAFQLQAVEQLQHEIIRQRYNGRFLGGLRGGIEQMLVSFANDAAVRRIHGTLTEMVEQIALAQAEMVTAPFRLAAEQQAAAMQGAFDREQGRLDDRRPLDRELAPAREERAHELRRLNLESQLRQAERAAERPHELAIEDARSLAIERQALNQQLTELRAEDRRSPSRLYKEWIAATLEARRHIDQILAEADPAERRKLLAMLKPLLEQAKFGPPPQEGR